MADAIWSKLSGVFSKEVLHAQHVSVFCHILQVSRSAQALEVCAARNLQHVAETSESTIRLISNSALLRHAGLVWERQAAARLC